MTLPEILKNRVKMPELPPETDLWRGRDGRKAYGAVLPDQSASNYRVFAGVQLDNRTFLDGAIRAIPDPDNPGQVNVALNVTGKTGQRTTVASSGEVRGNFAAILELRRGDLQNPAADIYLHNDVPVSSLVFCHPNGQPIGSFKKSFVALLKLAGVTHSPNGRIRTPYSLRHTYATERLNAGVQEYHLAKNMGTSVAMLEQHYGHTSTVGNVRELTKQRRKTGDVVDLEWLAA